VSRERTRKRRASASTEFPAYEVHPERRLAWKSSIIILREDAMRELALDVEELEERIAPSVIGNPGNNNPGQNNTNNPGAEGGGGNNVSAGATPQPNP
jgi:hypothetical protein